MHDRLLSPQLRSARRPVTIREWPEAGSSTFVRVSPICVIDCQGDRLALFNTLRSVTQSEEPYKRESQVTMTGAARPSSSLLGGC
jgi:hypothetical protein